MRNACSPDQARPVNSFSQRLLAWFDVEGRKDLPWQQSKDPYGIWVSEIMLQQTQVKTVIPYFERFVTSFPDVITLANADRDDVLRHWSGLGYYARARNLHQAAVDVRDEHDGVFPVDIDALMALPGIGRSTAGAILSLAYEQRHPILDGNVKRVLARHRAVDGWPGKAAVGKRLWELSDRCTPHERVGDYTQAIMDLGATLCTRSRPACDRCPVSADCMARISDTVGLFPARKTSRDKPLRRTTMLLASEGGRVFLERRPEAGIWGGLWSLPELGERSLEDWCSDKLQTSATATDVWPVLRHSFSHYDLDIQPIVVRVESPLSKVADGDSSTWYCMDETPPGGLAAPVKKLLEQLRDTN
ncbi:MAG: A/G-specific adenine glycosylase [Gammaproteobacteria bacterium]|nr:A/G-specific adenine glycosylase [Gammaproteobacteria bacterium]